MNGPLNGPVNGPVPGWGGEPALVPGELRGYRQFDVRADGLYPLVHDLQPWAGEVEQARCGAGHDHAAPDRDCRCGLYAWYLPGSATVALGPAPAVVAARGRIILGDRGFRAAGARVEAVCLPGAVRWWPPTASRTRAMLAERYPGTAVYSSSRRMLRDHPPSDVRALGIDPPPDRSRGYRTAAAAMWVGVLVLTYSLTTLPRDDVTAWMARWWPVLVVVTIGWQAGLTWLIVRLMALQSPLGPPKAPPRAPSP